MKIKKEDLYRTKGIGLDTPVFSLDTLTTKTNVDKYISEVITNKIQSKQGEDNEKA